MEQVNKDIFQVSADSRKMQGQLEVCMEDMKTGRQQEMNCTVDTLKEIKDQKIIMAGVLSSQLSRDLSQTFPAGNLIRSQMEAVEKLSYLEIRFMSPLLDAHEARRKLSQHIDLRMDFREMKVQAKQICEELCQPGSDSRTT